MKLSMEQGKIAATLEKTRSRESAADAIAAQISADEEAAGEAKKKSKKRKPKKKKAATVVESD
jgi:Zn-dependent protease with chaperone function